METKIILAQDEAAFLKKAAQLIMEAASAAIDARGIFTLVLSGGATPKKIYALLSDSYYKNRLAWPKIHVFWGDERMVPPNHPDSNFKMANDQLLRHIPLPAVNIHRIPGEMTNALEASKTYEQHLKIFFRQLAATNSKGVFQTSSFTGEVFPIFDLVLLGVGEDGHTASLFPGSSHLQEKIRWVTGGYIERVSSERVTMTFPLINFSRNVFVFCSGENKAAVVKEIFQLEGSGRRFPIQYVQPTEGQLVWIQDRGAASQLPASLRHKAIHI